MERIDINCIEEMRMAESLPIAAPSGGGESAQTSEQNNQPPKRRRGLPGTPDPEAEVVALSPKSLLEKNKYVCDICGKGFQREQNLQLHRRGHNLPWKLKQREPDVKKKVYVCPEPTCVHHDPARALGDLTGIKKHYCRKHGEKKFTCEKCNKSYAVQGDMRAHMRRCGTREHRCACGTVFSRRDSYITHSFLCDAALLAQETVRSQALTVAVDTITPSPPLQPPTPSTAVLSPPVLSLRSSLAEVHENRSGHSHQLNTMPLISLHSENHKQAAISTFQYRTKASALSLDLDIGNNNNNNNNEMDEDFASVLRLSLHTGKEKEPPVSLSLETPVYPSSSLFMPMPTSYDNQQPVLSATALLQKAAQICSSSSSSSGLRLTMSSSAAHDRRDDISSELSLALSTNPPTFNFLGSNDTVDTPTLDLLRLGLRGANQTSSINCATQLGMASSSFGGVLGDTRDDNDDQ